MGKQRIEFRKSYLFTYIILSALMMRYRIKSICLRILIMPLLEFPGFIDGILPVGKLLIGLKIQSLIIIHLLPLISLNSMIKIANALFQLKLM